MRELYSKKFPSTQEPLMIFHPSRCPQCGGKPVVVTDHVLIHSPLAKDDEDEEEEEEEEGSIVSADDELTAEEEDEPEEHEYAEFESQKVLWDTQEIYHFDDGTVMLACENDHGWSAVMGEDPGEGLPVPHSHYALEDACREIVACDTPTPDMGGDWGTVEWMESVGHAIQAARQALGLPDEPGESKNDG